MQGHIRLSDTISFTNEKFFVNITLSLRIRIQDLNLNFAILNSFDICTNVFLFHTQTKLVAPCQAAVDALSDLERRLQSETGVTSADPNIQSLRERCKNLQAEAVQKEQRLSHNKAQWQCFKTDMVGLAQWMGEAEAIQGTQVNTPSELGQLQTAIRRHKVSDNTGLQWLGEEEVYSRPRLTF